MVRDLRILEMLLQTLNVSVLGHKVIAWDLFFRKHSLCSMSEI